MVTRRDFGKIAFAGVPLSMAAAAGTGVTVGVSTSSFRDLPHSPGKDNIDAVIAALKNCGVTQIELASADLEPAGPNSGPAAPSKPSVYPAPIPVLSPEEIAEARREVRDRLREWRLAPPAGHFASVRTRLSNAGIAAFSLAVNYDPGFTDDEIEATFLQAEALGTAVITSPANIDVARRLAPFASKHKVTVALHNGAQSPAALAAALAVSKQFRIALDIGNLTAANGSPVAYLQENHASLSHIQIADRIRNGGANQPLGEGDTPVKDVLAVLKQKRYSLPVFVEYEYIGLGSPDEEVKACLAYVKAALA